MGRTEPSVGRPPAAFRRDVRAKRAKATLNKVIPSMLSAHPRARRGIEASELIVNPPSSNRKPKSARSESSSSDAGTRIGPRLVVCTADTLTAARSLLSDHTNVANRVAILSMASPLSPGGGFLNGATSQEEFLCMRTTLLPSLKDEFYRLPEVGAVYTPDVLVFRSPADDNGDEILDKKDRWFVDVVSAGMLRLPETEIDEETGRSTYVNAKDRDIVLEKMRAVMRVFESRGAARVVLGAWGCGAYGNPVGEIARAWRRVLLGEGKKRKPKEQWPGIEEVFFAIKDASMAEAFATAFGDGLEWAEETGGDDEPTDQEEADKEARVSELRDRVDELRDRVRRAPNARVREGLQAVMAGLESELPAENIGVDREE